MRPEKKTNKHVHTTWSTCLFQSSRFLQFGHLSLLAFFHQRARRVQRVVGHFVLLPERLLLGRRLFLGNRKSSTDYKETNIFRSHFSVSVRLKMTLIIFTELLCLSRQERKKAAFGALRVHLRGRQASHPACPSDCVAFSLARPACFQCPAAQGICSSSQTPSQLSENDNSESDATIPLLAEVKLSAERL